MSDSTLYVKSTGNPAVDAILSMPLPEVADLTRILGSEELAVKAVEYFGEEALIARRKLYRFSISPKEIVEALGEKDTQE